MASWETITRKITGRIQNLYQNQAVNPQQLLRSLLKQAAAEAAEYCYFLKTKILTNPLITKWVLFYTKGMKHRQI